MRFVYFYKTPDGQRHEAEIAAPSRDEAFAALRAKGVRPIKVIPKDSSRANGEFKGIRKRVVAALVLLAALIGGGIAFWGGNRPVVFYKADGSLGNAKGEVTAKAMTRRQIFGDAAKVRDLLAVGVKFLFQNSSECYLARYAQPGWPVVEAKDAPSVEDFEKALSTPIYTFHDEMAECVELKGIVAGMKEELRMFRAAGGTVSEYLERLVRRQKMEVDYRDKAAKDLKAILAKGDAATSYKSWKTVNDWLNAMGIAPLPLPTALERYVDQADEDVLAPEVIESVPVMVR